MTSYPYLQKIKRVGYPVRDLAMICDTNRMRDLTFDIRLIVYWLRLRFFIHELALEV